MNMYEPYVIKPMTVALIPKFDKDGSLITEVIEGTRSFLVSMKPIEIIEYSMDYYGHGLNVARIADKLGLGKVDMAPVKISGTLGLYWFPSKSPTKEDSVWFSLCHYKNAVPIFRNETIVFLRFGHTINILSRAKSFKHKVHKARELKSLMEDRFKEISFFLHKPQDETPQLREQNHTTYHFIQPNQYLNISSEEEKTAEKDCCCSKLKRPSGEENDI
ncbi:competence protein ComK [Lederbergia citrea]|uniref:Competence protein ComK n=1 Tax=Lederbergia citrea TaxID=2833581 RepID=A0A942UQX0_9BACI|nr:competence protein ComK [Lederbergia citrea]MBS4223308.1 competence protein ComK [Lederbergia citrea]